MSRAQVSYRRVLTGSLLAVAVAIAGAVGSAWAQQNANQRIGLDGYCPVCIVDAKKWEKGSPSSTATYDGVTYQFPNDAIKQAFLKNPAKYVPALDGDCIVCYVKLGKRVPGSIEF